MTLDWSPIIVGLINLLGIWLAHRSTAKKVDATKAQVDAVHTFVTGGGMLNDSFSKGGPVK